MMELAFDKDNSTLYTLNCHDKFSFIYHINTCTYPFFHTHKDYWEFTLITDGEITNVLNDKKYHCQRGTLFYSTTDDCHKLVSNKKNQNLRYLNFIIRERKLIDLVTSISPDFLYKLKTGNHTYKVDSNFIEQLEIIVHKVNLLEKNHFNEYNDLLCSAVILILQLLFSKNISEYNNESSWMKRLNNQIENPEFIKFNVNELCKSMKISRMQLNRLIQKFYNQTPHEFLNSYKLRYAKNLLVSTDMKIKDIAEQIGYSSFSSFFNNFKETYGITPNEIRKTRD